MTYRVAPEQHPLIYVNHLNVYALDRETGALRWRYETDRRIMRMLLAHECVYALDSNCVVHCIRVSDGVLLGKVPTGSPTADGANLLAADGRIYVATSDGVYALTPDGKKHWSFAAPPTGSVTLPGLGLPDQVFQPDFRD
jgi:outer membrane protein assembly factor BamB